MKRRSFVRPRPKANYVSDGVLSTVHVCLGYLPKCCSRVAQRAQGIASGGSVVRQLTPVQHHQQPHLIKRTHVSLLHQKLWETNASLEQNLAECIRGPLKEQSSRMQHLSGTLSAVQTSTLSTHNALTQASRNLSRTDFLLAGLDDNPLSSLKIVQ
ncbi:uncharacterized protein LOC123509207 isoform X1 [Portunus trituberculatus]|nr:uncharacterized protein LOC123509207 isoform X1 [Portunus trituberculatus]